MNVRTEPDDNVVRALRGAGIPFFARASPNQDERPACTAIDAVVIHYTALNLADSLVLLCDPQAKVSTHHVIDREGSVHQLVSVVRRAWHAGVSRLAGRERVNDFSVGVDLVFIPGVHLEYTEAQYRTLNVLLNALRQALPIPRARIVGHEHVALPEGRKEDPGPEFRWDRVGA